MHAHAAENLLSSLPDAHFQGGAILDVGSGSGYRTRLHSSRSPALVHTDLSVTAVLHHLVPHARVVGIEHIEPLVELSKRNLRADGVKLGAVEGGVEIVHGDGRNGPASLHLCSAAQAYSLRLAKAW